MKETTVDSIWSDDIQIAQPKYGYRFAVDSVLLAHFLKSNIEEEVLEIGAGSGVISILFSRFQPYKRLIAVEIQKELANLAKRNFEFNRLPSASVFEGDAREFSHPALPVDLIFSNPPYRKAGQGKLNPNTQKAIARHEIKFTLKDLFDYAKNMLKPRGRLSVILPEFREADFRQLVEDFGWHWLELQYVHSFKDRSPAFFLATAGKNPGPLEKWPPLTIYNRPGMYTDQMLQLLYRGF